MNDGGPILYVAHFLNVSPLVCRIDSSTKYEYPSIRAAITKTTRFVLIDVKNFIEETVLFEDHNHNTRFFLFPNFTYSS